MKYLFIILLFSLNASAQEHKHSAGFICGNCKLPEGLTTSKAVTSDLKLYFNPSTEQYEISTPSEHAYEAPKYDTTKGVIVYYDNHLQVKADSALLIKKADKTRLEYPAQPKQGEMTLAIYIAPKEVPDWYEWKIVTTKGNEIPLKHKIKFD